MSATLEELTKIDGVVAAGEFRLDGTLVDYRASMDMSPELAAQAAQFCATISMVFKTTAGAFTELSGMPWTPMQGWALLRGRVHRGDRDGGTKGVFVETAKATSTALLLTPER